LFSVALVRTEGQGGRSGFVDDTLHVKTRDLAGILGGLSLGVVEIGRYGDHSFLHGFS
jgi:hypothetical protein